MFRHDDKDEVQAEGVERVEVEFLTNLDKGHQAFLLHVVVKLALYLPGLACMRHAVSSDADACDIQVIQINMEYIIHFYKRVIGNMMLKMLVISHTRNEYTACVAQHDDVCLLTHSEVLGLLLCATAISTACCFNIAVADDSWNYHALFLVQLTFCIFVSPILALAVWVPPSVFFGGYVADHSNKLLLRYIYVVVGLETLFMFGFYI
jgi:hypothetical protein